MSGVYVKKRDVLNLIRYYSEHNDAAFRESAYGIAKDFDDSGDSQLANYILALLSNTNTFVPQSDSYDFSSDFLRKEPVVQNALPLPETIMQDVQGILNAIGHHVGLGKFLFQGPAGTGKTETVKQITAIMNRELYVVDFSTVIDSRLGQTAKNIVRLFTEMNSFTQPGQIVVLFDEIDALAMDRMDAHDVREMGRATSTLLKELDSMSDRLILFATTNLFAAFDNALIRRFDAVIDFGRYTRDDLLDIAEVIMRDYADQFHFIGRNMRLFRKIVNLMPKLPYPGDLKNVIRTAVAFSKPSDEYDYLRRLYVAVVPDGGQSIANNKILRQQGFTVREIEILTGISRSTVARELKESNDE
jgi:SpoVK/Ycf46/Vps4 family AAA+-type ATPase